MIAALFAALLALLAHASPSAGGAASPPAAGAVASGGDGRDASPPARAEGPRDASRDAGATVPPITADSPTCDDPTAVPGQCVVMQLPEETLGRAYG